MRKIFPSELCLVPGSCSGNGRVEATLEKVPAVKMQLCYFICVNKLIVEKFRHKMCPILVLIYSLWEEKEEFYNLLLEMQTTFFESIHLYKMFHV